MLSGVRLCARCLLGASSAGVVRRRLDSCMHVMHRSNVCCVCLQALVAQRMRCQSYMPAAAGFVRLNSGLRHMTDTQISAVLVPIRR
jgi:hypothetical protein